MKRMILACLMLYFSTTIIHAQQNTSVKVVKKDKGLVVSLKNGLDATIYIDGKKYDNEILKIIDINKIEAIQIFKGEEAINAYGVDKVVLITTKKEVEGSNVQVRENDNKTKLSFRDLNLDGKDESKYPVIIIDGKRSDQNDLKGLTPDEINSIKVLKDNESMKEYKTENGVIIVTTKKSKF